MILAKDVFLEETYKSNQSVLVLGVPGSGKSRSHVLLNMLEMDASFVALDCKGELSDTASSMLVNRGYNVYTIDFEAPLNTTSFYNPLAHIKNDEDVMKVSDMLLADMKTTTVDRFWPDSARILANALIAYLLHQCNPEDRTLNSVSKLLRAMDPSTIEKNEKSTLDFMFSDLKQAERNCFAVQQYELLRQCAMSEKTYACIIMSLISAFSGYMTPGIQHLTSKDSLNFKELGHKKTAIFVKSSDSDRSKDGLVSLFFRQVLDELYEEADSLPNHCLPQHVHFYMDDYGTNLVLPRFDAYIAGMRSREISCSVILQSEGQLKSMYGASWSTILGSCQSYVFLGSNDLETCEAISRRTNRPLDEILYKRYEDVYVFTQGQPPKKAVRYDLKDHPKYHMLNDPAPIVKRNASPEPVTH